MIVTVTLNPAVDKTALIDNIKLHALNRLKSVVTDIGGKGINVSKTIQSLGGKSIACGFLAGNSGNIIEKKLNDFNIITDFVYVEGETRTNLKLVEKEGLLTELNEQGPKVSSDDINRLAGKLEKYAKHDTIFVFGGSASPGIDYNIYQKLIEHVRRKGARIILDADGKFFADGLEAIPDVVKPNVFELTQYFAIRDQDDEKVLIQCGKKLIAKGINNIWISRGSNGALFLYQNKIIRIPGLKIKANSCVGAGDALVAAYAYGLDTAMPLEDCIKLAIATSAGAVLTKGTKPPSKDMVKRIIPEVEIQYLYDKGE
jgi:1-phosphofructokinase